MLHCAPRLLRQARDRGELATYRLGERTERVTWPELVRWVRSRQVRPTDHAEARVAEVLEREAAHGT